MGFSELPRGAELAKASGSVVRVGGGSGVIVQPQEVRCILTAQHVVRDRKGQVPIVWQSGTGLADVLKEDAKLDLALLSCPDALEGFAPIALAEKPSEVHVADDVWVIGFPSGWDDRVPVFAKGIVSGAGLETWVNIDATWGNSGGPVLSSSHELIGIVLGRGGAVEAALDATTKQLRDVVAQLTPIAKRGGVEIMGIDFGRFAQFNADALRAACEFIGSHFRSGYIRIADLEQIRTFLGAG